MFRIIIAIFILMQTPLFSQTFEWTNLGIGGGGAQFTPSISPIDPNLMIVSCDMSGVYRTTDGGASWKMIDWRQINSGINCYPVFHPIDVNTVYAYGQKGSVSASLLVSNDKGLTWNNLVASTPWGSNQVIALYIDRGNQNLMFAGTATSAYRSVNGGAAWTVCSTVAGKVLGFLVDQSGPTGAGRICFAATEAGGVYKSVDAGVTWIQKISGLPSAALKGFSGGSTASAISLYCVVCAGLFVT